MGLVIAFYRGGPAPVGFSGGYGRMMCIYNLEDSLSHPPDISNFVGGGGFSKGTFNN